MRYSMRKFLIVLVLPLVGCQVIKTTQGPLTLSQVKATPVTAEAKPKPPPVNLAEIIAKLDYVNDYTFSLQSLHSKNQTVKNSYQFVIRLKAWNPARIKSGSNGKNSTSSKHWYKPKIITTLDTFNCPKKCQHKKASLAKQGLVEGKIAKAQIIAYVQSILEKEDPQANPKEIEFTVEVEMRDTSSGRIDFNWTHLHGVPTFSQIYRNQWTFNGENGQTQAQMSVHAG